MVNAPGLIDSGYRGEIRVLLLNTDREHAFEIEPGDRIAQLLVVPFAAATPFESAALSDSDRGTGGFGSSGVG
jgi:dUTP pyrophosphatase